MNTKAVPFGTDQEESVYVEIFEDVEFIMDGASPGGTVAGGEHLAPIVKRFEEIGKTIADVCREIQEQTKKRIASSRPAELTLQFGVKLAGEAGIPLVTKGSAEGTFQVTAKWEFKSE
jgi:hypothetical protein